MATVKVVNVGQLTTEDRIKLEKAVKEMANAMARAKGEQEYIRETVASISEATKLPKKLVSKLVKAVYKQDFDESVAEQEQFESLYKAVVQ